MSLTGAILYCIGFLCIQIAYHVFCLRKWGFNKKRDLVFYYSFPWVMFALITIILTGLIFVTRDTIGCNN
jgi:hypothetical protein